MKKEQCETCKFFHEVEPSIAQWEAWGTCNRYPPVLFCSTPEDPVDISDEIEMMWKQPAVVGNSWCGEFKEKS